MVDKHHHTSVWYIITCTNTQEKSREKCPYTLAAFLKKLELHDLASHVILRTIFGPSSGVSFAQLDNQMQTRVLERAQTTWELEKMKAEKLQGGCCWVRWCFVLREKVCVYMRERQNVCVYV